MKCVFTFLIAITTSFSFAQHPNHKVWIFGNNAGFNFHTQPPTPLTSGSEGWESFASQCDEQGNLLFYTNGESVKDKQHSIMPYGDSLKGNIWGSTSQGVQVIPHPVNVNQYIIFSLEPEESYSQFTVNTNGRLHYSVVDMTFNSGLGDVVPGQKNILIDSLFSEHMMVVGNECKMWLITHTAFGPGFRCYEITEQGLNTTPVVSSSGTSGNSFRYIRGEIVYDPVRKHIFLSTPDSTYSNGILEMHDFDMMTGVVSNPQLLNNNGIYYRLCVSPEGSKLYAGGYTTECVLDQFDVSLGTVPAIINSKATIFSSFAEFTQDMAVGPDSIIYGSRSANQSVLFRITEPEMSGMACGFDYNGIAMAPNTSTLNGLPAPSVRRFVSNTQDAVYEHDTTICNAQLTLNVPDNTYVSYLWSTGDTGLNVLVTQPGTYWLESMSDCKKRVDTFNVADFAFEPHAHDTSICFTSSAVLTAPVSLPNYLWSDGSTGSQITITQPGTYWVFATDFCLETVDTFHVSFVDFTMSLPGDTVVCDSLAMSPSVDVDGVTYLWQDGSTGNSYTVTASGAYWVEVNKNGCKKADTMFVDNRAIQLNLGNDTLLCENVPLTLKVDHANTTYLWQDGSTGNEYEVTVAGVYSVLGDNAVCSATDTIKVDYEKCNCIFNVPSVFTPNADGKNDGFNPVIELSCPVSEYTFSIFNRWGECVFSATDKTDKWNGRYKGELADVGVYMYMLNFKGAKGKVFTKKGDVTLLR
jgi:gliding motility-associated-like protein